MPYSPTTWTEDITPVGPTNLNKLEAGVVAAVPKDIVTTAGDVVYATGSATLARLALGATGTVLTGGASAPSWVRPPGYEYAYNEFTGIVAVSATTEATANTVVTASAVTFDGATIVLIEFCAPYMDNGATTRAITAALFEDGVSIGTLAVVYGSASQVNAPARVARRRTPASGSRTYSVRAYMNAGTGSVSAGAGGAGAVIPGFIRITKAV